MSLFGGNLSSTLIIISIDSIHSNHFELNFNELIFISHASIHVVNITEMCSSDS